MVLSLTFSLNFQGDQRLAITPPFPETSDSRIRALRAQVPKIQDLKFYHVKDSYEEVVQGLIKYENQLLVKNYKFGILYVKEGQTDENQYFNNSKFRDWRTLIVTVNGSRAFDGFLNCIGDRIALKGWNKFSGGLDTKGT